MCNHNWDINNANVVCRELGYPGASDIPWKADLRAGFGDVILDDVHCVGDETSMFDCQHGEFGVHDCNDAEDASVVCEDTGNLTII